MFFCYDMLHRNVALSLRQLSVYAPEKKSGINFWRHLFRNSVVLRCQHTFISNVLSCLIPA